MKFPICGKIRIHVPNHQAEFEWACWAIPIFRYIQNYPNVPKPPTIYIYTLIPICKFCVCDRITTSPRLYCWSISDRNHPASALLLASLLMPLAVKSVFWNVGFRFLLCWFYSFGCCLFLQYFLLALDHLFLQFFFFLGGVVDPKRYQVWWCLFYNVKLWGIVILRYYCIWSHYFLGHSFFATLDIIPLLLCVPCTIFGILPHFPQHIADALLQLNYT